MSNSKEPNDIFLWPGAATLTNHYRRKENTKENTRKQEWEKTLKCYCKDGTDKQTKPNFDIPNILSRGILAFWFLTRR